MRRKLLAVLAMLLTATGLFAQQQQNQLPKAMTDYEKGNACFWYTSRSNKDVSAGK